MDIILTDRLLFDTLFCSVILLFIAILLDRFFYKENRALNILDVINFLLIIVVGTTLGFFAVTYRESSNALHFIIPWGTLLYGGIFIGTNLYLVLGAVIVSNIDTWYTSAWAYEHEPITIIFMILCWPIVLICIMIYYYIQMFINLSLYIKKKNNHLQ